MAQYDFDSSKYFFAEIVTFSMTLVGFQGIFSFDRAKKELNSLVTFIEGRRKGLALPRHTVSNVVIPDLNEVLGQIVTCTLVDSQHFAVSIQTGGPVTKLSYADQGLVTPMEGRRVEIKIPEAVLPLVAQVTVGSAFEQVSERFEKRWTKDTWKWPPLLQYFRHIRNAAFHGNSFEVRSYRGKPGIDASNPPTWRSSVMPDDNSMNGQKFMGGWWKPGDVPIFLGEVGEFLRTSGIRPSGLART